MTPEPLRFNSQCRICGKTYAVNDLSIPIVGKQPRERIVALVTLFTQHLQQKHSQELQEVGMAVQDMYGLEVLSRFTHEEPVLLQTMNNVRKAFHWTTQGPQASDPYILDRVARLELSNGDQEKVIELCKSLRDFLTERPEQPVIVQT